MLNRITVAAALVAAASLLGCWHLKGQLDAARAEVAAAQKTLLEVQAARKKDAATSVLREKLRAARGPAEAAAGVRLETALDTAPTWENQPVPQEIQDALAP